MKYSFYERNMDTLKTEPDPAQVIVKDGQPSWSGSDKKIDSAKRLLKSIAVKGEPFDVGDMEHWKLLPQKICGALVWVVEEDALE